MLDYLNHKINLDNHIVESNYKKNNYYFNFDIFYDYSPILNLPASIEDFESTHKSKFWYNIRRSTRLFENEVGEICFEVYKNKQAYSLLDNLRQIFLDRWSNTYTSFYWKRDSSYTKYKNLIQNLIVDYPDCFCVSVLKIKSSDEIIAYSVGFEMNSCHYFWMHSIKVKYSLSKFSLGTVLLNYLLRDLIKKNIKQFDFMLGLNDYKLKWTKKKKKIYWRVKTKRRIINIPLHIFSVFFYLLKIKIQKNKFISKFFKKIFFYLENKNYLKNLFRTLETKVFKM